MKFCETNEPIMTEALIFCRYFQKCQKNRLQFQAGYKVNLNHGKIMGSMEDKAIFSPRGLF